MKTKIEKTLREMGFNLYLDREVFDNAPLIKSKGKIEFFNLGKYISCDELQEEYEKRGLIPTDITSIVNALKKEDLLQIYKYIGMQWKDKENNWCYATFNLYVGGRDLYVYRSGHGWHGLLWFAGVRNVSLSLDSKPSLDSLSFEKRLKVVEKTLEKLTKIINL